MIICVGVAVLISCLSGYCFKYSLGIFRKGESGGNSMLFVAFLCFYVAIKLFGEASDYAYSYKMEKNSSYVEATLEGINPEMCYGLTSVGFVRFTKDVPNGTLDYLNRYYKDSVLIFKMADNPKKGERMVFEVKVP